MTDFEWNYKNILDIAIHVRERLREEFTVDDPSIGCYHFSGLCHKAISMFFEELEEKYADGIMEHIGFHGELVHSIKIPSKYWGCQHTWGLVIIKNQKTGEKYEFYVDITGEQFNELLVDEFIIPDIYISNIKPPYLLPDNENIYVKSMNKWYENIVDIFEYDIKGKLYDFIRFCLKG